MLVIDVASHVKKKTDHPLWFMWACLLHDIGKPLVTTKEGHAPKHNEAGVQVFQNVDVYKRQGYKMHKCTSIIHYREICVGLFIEN